jgi:hypothetical protein
MSRFPKKILLPISEKTYIEVLSRSKLHGTSVNAELRMAISLGLQTNSTSISKPEPTLEDLGIDDLEFSNNE